MRKTRETIEKYNPLEHKSLNELKELEDEEDDEDQVSVIALRASTTCTSTSLVTRASGRGGGV